MAVVGMVSRSKVLLMVDLNRVFSLANLIGTGKCHERLQCRHVSGVHDAPLAPPPEAAATSTSSYTTSVRNSASASNSPSTTPTPSLSSGDDKSSTSRIVDNFDKAAAVTLAICKQGHDEYGKKELESSSDVVKHRKDVLVQFRQGLPQVTVPLPSRKEYCRFTLRPVSNTVGDFLNMIRHEDKGVDRVAILTRDGVRIASSNSIESLIQEDFKLIINDREYKVDVPKPPKMDLSKDDLNRLADVRSLVNQLYEALNVEDHQLRKEKELVAQLEDLKVNLEPLEQKRQYLEAIALRRTNVLTWCGLGLMSVQFGILARLTWWEYSWDIMEPVTYFVTYGTAMAAYAYYVLTKQEFVIPDVRDREHLNTLHKRARKLGLDINQYNVIKDEIARIEYDLSRLRDPLHLHLPLQGKVEPRQEATESQGSSTFEKLRTMFGKVIKDKEKA